MNPRLIVVACMVAFLFAPGASSWAAEPERRDGAEKEAPKRERPPASALPQKVIKVDEKTITVIPAVTFADGPEPVEETLRIDKERTKVFVFEETEREDADLTTRIRGRFRPGTLAELKAGQTVRYRARDGLANEIRVMPKMTQPGEPRPGKGGEQ
jgi:hypothetical protein